MSNFIPFDTPNGTIWIQVEDSVDGTAVVNTFLTNPFDSFEATVAALTSNAQFIRDLLVDLQPSDIEITFGIKAGLNPGAVGVDQKRIFALAQNPGNANYRIKVKWEEKNDAG